MIREADLDACRTAIRTGSHSFYAASRLLPARVRDPALALYAFCRLADDAVDEHAGKLAAVARLRHRLDLAYAGCPKNTPADRAFTALIENHDLPRALPDALLEGLQWDAEGRRYRDMGGLHAYSVRVASSVGLMMCVIMGVRTRHDLARAADLGVAMQLTNIARDVGEDAREGRLYLPLEHLSAHDVDPEEFLRRPTALPGIRSATEELLAEAHRLYRRANLGVRALPADCRPGILAASHIYRAIGAEISKASHDSISKRARTRTAQKLGLALKACADAGCGALLPRAPAAYSAPLPEAAWLVEATALGNAGVTEWGDGRAGTLMSVFAHLEAQDRQRRKSGDAAIGRAI